MAVLGEEYEVIITVRCLSHQYEQPCGIRFYVPSIYADRHFWRDAKVMMGLAQKVLTNFAHVFLKAVDR
jgi:hypothetical protein